MRTAMLMVVLVSLPESMDAQVTSAWFNDYVRLLGQPVAPTIVPERAGDPIPGLIIRDGVEIPTQTQTYEAQKAAQDYVVLAPNAGEIWAGNLVQYAGLKSGILNPIGLELNKRVITVDVPGGNRSLSRTLEVGSFAAYRDSLAGILNVLPKTLPAQMSYSAQQVYDANHARFALDAAASWPTGKINAALETINSRSRSNLLLNFAQVYYTVSVQRPTAAATFIETGLFKSRQTVREYMSPDNPPAYVASVSYGRRIVVAVSSNESADVLKAVFQAAYDAVGSGELKLSAEQRRVYRNSNLTVVVLGGNPENAAEVIKNPTIEQLVETIREGASYSPASPGHPLSYTVRFLTNNRVASVAVPAEWSKYSENAPAYRRPFRFTVSGDGFTFYDTADDDEDLDWSIHIEALGQKGQVVGQAFSRSAGDRHVFQYGKDRDRCKNNCFYRGEELLINEPVFKIRWTITVRTRDGDGKRWGVNRGEIDVNRPSYTIAGGHDGEWKLPLTFGN